MPKVKKILVPIDFSSCSENALAYALQFADKIKATIQVVNVPPFEAAPLDYPAMVAISNEETIKASRMRMNKSIEKITEELSSLLSDKPQIQTNIELGVADTKICEIAARDQVDYIVMGTQGENSFWDRYLGSIASNVLKYSPCPVYVIPEKAIFPEKIIMGYATSFSDADPFGIWRATRLLHPMPLKVHCVHFNKKNELVNDRIDQLEQFFADNNPDMDIGFHSIPTKDMVKDLNDFIDQKNINVMVMYKPRRTFFESIFHKSYTQKMAKHTDVPLLVLKETI